MTDEGGDMLETRYRSHVTRLVKRTDLGGVSQRLRLTLSWT